MSAAVALQEYDQFRSKLQETSGFARAVRIQTHSRGVARKMLLELRRLLIDVIRTGERVRTLLRAFLNESQDLHDDRELQGLLWRVADSNERLHTIIGKRAGLRRSYRMIVVYWTDDIQARLQANLDDMEDLTETLALGLSPGFRGEVTQRREEAGLTDAVAPT
jgi:hypothetical protein